MTENGGKSTGEAIEDDEEKYNYYHCKYTDTNTHNFAAIFVYEM